ncbi:Permease of the major facilitator superfamily protein [Roseibium aggregatum IAM 12614]|uniref:Permease of the major facilitator superfamily protein n=1 Tax=Roseibium aggregatum (strain ATCC 25650 / DSM 13394 / JCM 20685 / NBRC 16684 / NCIMB 2208 / IAM 12614 / B1) TaxID=384765 RepID=A0NPM3_ROSAI|nr:MFS transporter [Roseibium aggregatum]EAV45386.1 Permease of the major facilitator superfamily protein [Roseibium aggregatum IAM 12614]
MSLDRSSISSRVSALFASHFFGVGLFLPFIPVVLGFRGLTAAEIGFVLGIGTIARIAASPLLSNLSDRTGQRRLSILIYSLAAATFIGLYFLPLGLVFLSIAVIGYMVMNAPVVPLSDAYALDVQRNTGADYARMRLWGSAGFVVASIVGGSLAAEGTSWLIVVAVGLASLATGAVAMSLPRQKRRDASATSGAGTGSDDDDMDTPFKSVWFWPLLVVLGLYQASHSAFYGFGTLYWQAMDVPDFAIGLLWATGVAAEIALFTVAGKLAQRFDPPLFLLAAGAAATVRWLLFPFADTVSAMAALQTLHGLSFGAAHLGAVAILARVVPSRWAGTGQGLLATSVGIQMAIGLSVSGAIYEINPDWPFFVMSVVAAIGTLLTLAMTPMLRKRMAAE